MNDLFRRARTGRLSTSTISDILDAQGIDGVLHHQLSCVNQQDHFAIGYAYVVEWTRTKKGVDITAPQSSTWDQVRQFVAIDLESARDHIYVAGCGALMLDGALAGGISCTYLNAIGFEAVVLGGAVRDAKQLSGIQLPVIASNFIPADTQGFFKVNPQRRSCVIDNKVVNAGDVVVSDRSGTIVIPRAVAEEVLNAAIRADSEESELLALAAKGGDILSYIQSGKRI